MKITLGKYGLNALVLMLMLRQPSSVNRTVTGVQSQSFHISIATPTSVNIYIPGPNKLIQAAGGGPPSRILVCPQ